MGFWKSLPRKAAAWRAFTPAERVMLVRALGCTLLAELSLRLLGLENARRLLRPRRPTRRASGLSAPSLVHLADVAARNAPMRVACLGRSLALQRLLALDGISSELLFGVRKEGDALKAHAWLDVEGIQDGSYVPLEASGPTPAAS